MFSSTMPKVAVSAVALAAGSLTLLSAPAADAATTFANCTAMHRTFKHGVAKSDRAAAAQVRQGYGRPAVRYRIYMANYRSMDRDRDGTACEA